MIGFKDLFKQSRTSDLQAHLVERNLMCALLLIMYIHRIEYMKYKIRWRHLSLVLMRTHQASSSLSVSSMTPRWMRFVLFPREWVPFCFRLADITGLTEGSKLPTCRETYWAAKYNEWHELTWPCIDYGSTCLPLHWSRQHGKWAGTCNRYNIDAKQPAISGDEWWD